MARYPKRQKVKRYRRSFYTRDFYKSLLVE